MKDTLWTIKPNRHFNLFWQYRNQPADTRADRCPYCESREVVKRGRRHKKFETVQLYRCKACTKTFSAQIVKGKHYPLRMILDAVSLYNLGYIRSEVCRLIKEKYGPEIKPSTLTNWIRELAPLCRYARHAMGKHLIEKTGNLAAVQRQLGHTNATYSMQYTRITDEELGNALEDR